MYESSEITIKVLFCKYVELQIFKYVCDIHY